MQKKSYIFIGIVLVGVAIYFCLIQFLHPSESQTMDIQNANAASAVEYNEFSEVATNVPVFERVAIPKSSISEEECSAVNANAEFNKKRRYVLKAAAQAYFSGSTKQEVADAIWFELNWLIANRWYNRALNYESFNRALPILKLTNPDISLIHAIEDFNTLIASGSEINDIADFSKEAGELWTDISFTNINESLFSDESVDNILARINESIAHIPTELLSNPQLSPVLGMIPSIVSSKRIDVALGMLAQNPNLSLFNSEYENQFRSRVVSALNYDLSDARLKKDAHELLSKLNLYDGRFRFYEVPSFFDQFRLKEALTKLKSQNLDISYQIVNDEIAPQPALQFSYDNQLIELAYKLEAECNAKESWAKSRRLSRTEWQTFEQDDFLSSVTSSFEYNYCDIQSSSYDYKESLKTVENAISVIQKHLLANSTTVAETDLQSIVFSGLGENERAILSIALTTDLLMSGELDEAQIVQKLSAADFAPQPNNIQALQLVSKHEGLSVWLDKINFGSIPNSYLLLNQFAEDANFAFFEQSSDKIDIEDKDMFDPFYFFIRGYSTMSLSFVEANNHPTRENTEFINYFEQNGVEVKEHHLREAFRRKLTSEYSYRTLVESFSQLAVDDNEDYFSVQCD